MRWVIFLLSAFPAWAQTTVRLTLDEAVALALRQHPAVATARQAVEEAEARVKQARANYFPHLGFNGIAKVGLSGATNALGLVGLPNSPFYRNLADSLNASYRAYDFGRTRHGMQSQRFLRDAAEADLNVTEASVIFGAERAFYGLLQARRLRDVAAETQRSRELTVRQAQAFYEGKIRSRLDLDLARIGLSRAQLALVEAENGVRVAAAELGRALSASQDADYDLEPPELAAVVRPDPLPKLIQEAFERRPELRALRAERESAAEEVALARSQRKPSLSLAFSGGYARFTNVLARQLLAGGAGLVLPLYTGGSIEGRIEESEARLRRLDARLEDLLQQVGFETRSAWFRLQNALQTIPVEKLQTEHARQATRLARARYRERLGAIVELTEAQAGLAEAELAEASGAYRVKIAEAELRRAVGRR